MGSFIGSAEPYYLIEMRGNNTLVELNDAIQNALQWDNDHLYSFFIRKSADDKKFMEEVRRMVAIKYEFLDYLGKKGGARSAGVNDEIERKVKEQAKQGVEYSHPYELEEWQRSAKIGISRLGLSENDRFEYLFDYGDEHRFDISVVAVKDAEEEQKGPRMVKRFGRTPRQY